MAWVDGSFLTTDLTNLSDLFAWVDTLFLTTDLTDYTDLFDLVDWLGCGFRIGCDDGWLCDGVRWM